MKNVSAMRAPRPSRTWSTLTSVTGRHGACAVSMTACEARCCERHGVGGWQSRVQIRAYPAVHLCQQPIATKILLQVHAVIACASEPPKRYPAGGVNFPAKGDPVRGVTRRHVFAWRHRRRFLVGVLGVDFLRALVLFRRAFGSIGAAGRVRGVARVLIRVAVGPGSRRAESCSSRDVMR
jgi:hypothetical protein